ncbi:hypothetical protein NDU88_011297 [Pleurodeles waltl]|uniref:Uncharacterized protein n=1 Tax=Pleurodeles waltl TaxID=8319 RepID=A0AAV7QYE6_PLEWA|nr:hypothetical protein NDU88_011297 [Pleurodeles waltl]
MRPGCDSVAPAGKPSPTRLGSFDRQRGNVSPNTTTPDRHHTADTPCAPPRTYVVGTLGTRLGLAVAKKRQRLGWKSVRSRDLLMEENIDDIKEASSLSFTVNCKQEDGTEAELENIQQSFQRFRKKRQRSRICWQVTCATGLNISYEIIDGEDAEEQKRAEVMSLE